MFLHARGFSKKTICTLKQQSIIGSQDGKERHVAKIENTKEYTEKYGPGRAPNKWFQRQLAVGFSPSQGAFEAFSLEISRFPPAIPRALSMTLST